MPSMLGAASTRRKILEPARFGRFVLALALLLAGCADFDAAPTPRAPISTRAVTRTLFTPTPRATLAPAATPANTATAIAAVARALQSANAQGLSPLIVDSSIWLAQGPNGEEGDAITRAAALQWLNARWSKNLKVTDSDYVEQSDTLTVGTNGWAKVAPMAQGIIAFRLHRYSQNQTDAVNGTWQIDAVIYQ
jgi:hypothetical protein